MKTNHDFFGNLFPDEVMEQLPDDWQEIHQQVFGCPDETQVRGNQFFFPIH